MSPIETIFAAAIFLSGLQKAYTQAVKSMDENRPYEFSFNIVDFQHRQEKKDADGIITGEFGWISADGIYRETSYATDKNGDFRITAMTYRKIKSVRDAKMLFEKKPEATKMLIDALTKACGGCALPADEEDADFGVTSALEGELEKPTVKKLGALLRKMKGEVTNDDEIARVSVSPGSPLAGNETPRNAEGLKVKVGRMTLTEENTVTEFSKGMKMEIESGRAAKARKKMIGDLLYKFNYTLTSHEHREEGFRSGNKNGGYRTESGKGIETKVEYVSNENGHQPNVTFVLMPASGQPEEETLKGRSFVWYWE